MSIRVTSSGHNFSTHTPTPPSEDKITILIESVKAMLLPTVLLNDCSYEEHLFSAGIAVQSPTEEVILVQHDAVTSALIVIPSSLKGEIEQIYGDKVSYTTPLLKGAPSHGHDLSVDLSQDGTLLCLSLFNGGDRVFAELFEIKGEADVLYWITRLGGGYDLSTYTIYIDRENKELERLLKRYHKSVKVCE